MSDTRQVAQPPGFPLGGGQDLTDVVAILGSRFAGHFAPETVERYVYESCAALKRTSHVTTYLPVLTQTFATSRLSALAKSRGSIMSDKPEVLFVCVHNAGRSQMAAALLDLHATGRVHVRSAGSQPAGQLNPAVVEAMDELGLDLSKEFPKPLTDDVVRAADVVITMGCGDACPIYPGKKYLDWDLEDPAGKDLDTVRRIRYEIDQRVLALVEELTGAQTS